MGLFDKTAVVDAKDMRVGDVFKYKDGKKYEVTHIGMIDGKWEITCYAHGGTHTFHLDKYSVVTRGPETVGSKSVRVAARDVRVGDVFLDADGVRRTVTDVKYNNCSWEVSTNADEGSMSYRLPVFMMIERGEKDPDFEYYKWCTEMASDAIRSLPKEEMMREMRPMYEKLHS